MAEPVSGEDKPPTYMEATAAPPPAGAAGGLMNPAGSSGATYGTQGGTYGQPPAGVYKPEQYQQPYAGGYQSGAAPGVYQGPPGYQPVMGQQPSYLGTTITVQHQPSVVVVGGCPACRIGVLEDDFTLCGVCCAILFFPLGILCCLAMRQRHCPNCGAVFS